MRTLFIIGAGGLGRETAILVERVNASTPPETTWTIEGFVDDDQSLLGQEILGYTVAGDTDWFNQVSDATCILAIAAPSARRRLSRTLSRSTPHSPVLTDPDVFLHHSVEVGAGSLVFRGAVIMTAVHLGRSVIVDVNATVGHDASIGSYTTIHPGVHVSGNASIGDGVRLGAGSVVLPGVSIGSDTVVGAGAVVNRDLPPGCTAAGVPARPLSK